MTTPEQQAAAKLKELAETVAVQCALTDKSKSSAEFVMHLARHILIAIADSQQVMKMTEALEASDVACGPLGTVLESKRAKDKLYTALTYSRALAGLVEGNKAP